MKVTMQTIADELGVSRNAVSLALRNDPSISEATRGKVVEAADRLGYRRNPAHGELMSQMRLKGHGKAHATLGIFNANQNPKAFAEHPTIPLYLEGCMRRSNQLGYLLDSFWLREPDISGKRWTEILKARGVRGIVLVGLMKENRLPSQISPLIEAFPMVVTGVRTRDPALPFACVDHHVLALRAFERAIDLGYKRPGLVLDRAIDELVEHRFSAGYRSGQESLPKSRRLEPYLHFDSSAAESGFQKWMIKKKPDVIFALYNEVERWLSKLGLYAPDDIGLIQLEWRESEPRWAGMNQHNDIAGEAAVDMIIGAIHRGDTGVQEFPRATLIGPTWVDGETVRKQELFEVTSPS